MMITPTHFGRVDIHEAPHGINIVIDTQDAIYIGRFDNTDGFEAILHDCAKHAISPGIDPEIFVKETAKYGVSVELKDLRLPTSSVKRVRILGDVGA